MKKDTSPLRELILLSGSVFVLAAALVWVRALTVKATYQFVEKERHYRQMEQETQRLRVKWLKITSPKKLEILAEELGLEPPKMSQNLKLQSTEAKRENF
ncbi:MAG: hypothetical protein FJ112_08000 [Deltaproteobacteria bacterium]|nr:hypothetical protein [Deltaproteobacteria bacterium]